MEEIMTVVRCKDCKYNLANKEKGLLDMNDYIDIVCTYFITYGLKPNDYCSKGELYENDIGD